MSTHQRKICECIYKNCCKSCNYGDPRLMDPIQYDYWNQTWWLNWNTTDGWGAFPSSDSGQNNNTYDNVSGYGLTSGVRSGTLPDGKKLVRVYKFNNRFYQKAGDLVFYEGKWVPVSNLPGVEKIFVIKTV